MHKDTHARSIPEEAVRATAGIVGPHSSSALAIRRAEELRAMGYSEISFFKDGTSLLVTGRQPRKE